LQYYAKQKEDDHVLGMAKAELKFTIENEMVQTPMDFFIRRTGRLYFDIDSIRSLMEPILAEFKTIYKLDDEVINSYRKTLEREMDEHSNFSLDRI
jgi:glycerol-3-phosphate dehydrogenase